MLSISIAATAQPNGKAPSPPALDDPRQIELRRQRLVRDRRQRLAQQIALIGEAGDAFGDVGMAFQIGGDFRLPLGFENADPHKRGDRLP